MRGAIRDRGMRVLTSARLSGVADSHSRREFLRRLAALGLSAAGFAVAGCGGPSSRAPGPAKIPLVGYLDSRRSDSSVGELDAFRGELRELGYAEGQAIAIEYRYADGDSSRLPRLAAELVEYDLDVIVAFGTQANTAAKAETSSIPIVMAVTSDPVRTGLVASLARPGGNVTGSTSNAPQLAGKRLELLKELVPSVSRVAVLWDPSNRGDISEWEATQDAAKRLGMHPPMSLEVTAPGEFVDVFHRAVAERTQALVPLASSLIIDHRIEIVKFTSVTRLPAIFSQSEFVEAGGLMSYGPNYRDLYRRAAVFVDKILKGARPADLPVEKAQRYTLVVNLRTAQALGLTIPRALRVQVDEVI